MKYKHEPQFGMPHRLMMPWSAINSGTCPATHIVNGYVEMRLSMFEWLEQNIGEHREAWCYMQRHIWFRSRDHAMLFKLTFS